ncbi:hypothetical protein L7F22_020892 [Adiantum nelumboides]|nr:hypothetical protein [Adiantum nelumboides]
MNLRSGNLYKSGRGASYAGTSQRSSEESVTNARQVLEPIVEDSFESSSNSSMASGTPTASADMHGPFSMAFNVRLAFAHVNLHGAELYRDPMNRWVVKIAEPPTQFDPAPFVNYQGEAYMGQEGDHYVVTSEPGNVDKWGQQVPAEKPEEPPFRESPDMRLFDTLKVTHIPVDDLSLAVYKRETVDANHVYFAKDPLPQTIAKEKLLYVYLNSTQAPTITAMFFDKFAVRYKPLDDKAVQDLTKHGMPIPELVTKVPTSSQPKYMGDGESRGKAVPNSSEAASSRADARSGARPVPSAPPFPQQQSGSAYVSFRGASAPEVHFATPSQIPQAHMDTVFVPRNDQSAAFPGRHFNDARKIRPADLQKWVKKFNGSGDPYDHLASFRQITRAEKVTDLHILVEGFGLTLEGKALSWFQTLDVGVYPTINALEKEFVAAFSKTGFKNDVLSQIHGFNQTEKETVRDCANRLRQYLARCSEAELPKQERLVSIFIEGLRSKSLHSALFMKNHTNLNQCILDAIKYDDNCDTDKDDVRSKSSESSRKAASQIEDIIKGVAEKMQQMYGPPRAMDRKIMKPYICGVCGGDHPTSQCLPKNPGPIRQEPQLSLWCDFHKRWGNHATENCYNRMHQMREQAMGNAFRAGMEGEKPAPVSD